MESAVGYISARDKLDQRDDTDIYEISVAIILLLLSYCFPHTQDGDTALHYASINGHLEVVKLLLQSHADVNIKGRVSTESPRYSTIHSLLHKSGKI